MRRKKKEEFRSKTSGFPQAFSLSWSANLSSPPPSGLIFPDLGTLTRSCIPLAPFGCPPYSFYLFIPLLTERGFIRISQNARRKARSSSIDHYWICQVLGPSDASMNLVSTSFPRLTGPGGPAQPSSRLPPSPASSHPALLHTHSAPSTLDFFKCIKIFWIKALANAPQLTEEK